MYKNSCSIIALLILVLGFFGCKPNVVFDEVPTELRLTVRLKGKPAVGSVVYIYTDSSSQINSAANFTKGNPIDSAIVTDSTKGLVIFKLKPDVFYYMNVYYKMYDTKYGKNFIYYDNSQSGYEFLWTLNERAITEASVDLFPAEGFVNFYASNSPSGTVPIRMSADYKDAKRTINTTITSIINSIPANAISVAGANTFKLRYGKYALGYINKNGCSGVETIEVFADSVINFNLNKCNSGAVSFWTSNKAAIPITVVLDINNTIGGISKFFTAEPNPINSSGTLYRNLPDGIYNYYASSNTINAAWTGTFTISGTSTLGIKLE
ncbi:MAG: hypothetical protein SFY32_06535 [Bacteroidota bacterium]|nr:hypothetical protein [Bacteroidota bacterium]